MAEPTDKMESIINLCKRRGFVFASSEIYGGLNGFFDYGPLGAELKNNIKQAWWQDFVHRRDDIVGLDSCVVLAREVWEASGHVATFTDPLTECTSCHKRYRADHLEEAFETKHKRKPESLSEINCPARSVKGMRVILQCPVMQMIEPFRSYFNSNMLTIVVYKHLYSIKFAWGH